MQLNSILDAHVFIVEELMKLMNLLWIMSTLEPMVEKILPAIWYLAVDSAIRTKVVTIGLYG